MAVEITVPSAGESVTEGVIAEWLKKDGDFVAESDPLFELETDKVTMTVNSTATGRLAITVPAGKTVQIGQVVATVDPAVAAPAVAAPAGESAASASAAAIGDGQRHHSPTRPAVAAAASPMVEAEREPDAVIERLSPAVRQLMRKHNLHPNDVRGSGRGGRITPEDVLRVVHAPPGTPHETPTSPPPSPPSARPADVALANPSAVVPGEGLPRQVRRPMSQLRKRLAKRLVEAQSTAAMLTTFNEADMSGVMALRDQYKDAFEKKHGVKLGFMSFFVKAVVEGLQAVPAVNAFIDGDDIVENHFYDIGVAVSTEKGLVVPVIRDADKLGFAEIEKTIGQLAVKARERQLTLQDLTGGCFTVSNGGIFGSMLSTPILNFPQSAILGMHAIKKRPVVLANDQIAVRPMMYLAVSYDHRLIDGAEAVTFLKRIVDCIEQPQRLLLGV